MCKHSEDGDVGLHLKAATGMLKSASVHQVAGRNGKIDNQVTFISVR